MRGSANILFLCAGGLCSVAAAAPVEVIYTNISGHPTAQVPGVVGEEFRAPLVPFLTLYGSPDGSHWVFKAFTDNPSSDDNDVIIVGSGLAGTTVAKEGQPSPLGGLTYGFMDSDCGVNDSGHYVFGNRLSGGATTDDEILFMFDGGSIVAAVREGDAAPDLFDPGVSGDEVYGNSLNSAHILNDDTVGYKADQIDNIPTDYESALYHGSMVQVQEGTSAETLAGGAVYDSFIGLSGNTFSSSADGSAWIVEADVEAGLTTVEAVVVTGNIEFRDGDLIAGSASPVDAVFSVDMSGAGDWFATGQFVNTRRFAVRNGTIIAQTGDPIIDVPNQLELFEGGILDADGNSSGDYYVIAETNTPDTDANQVVVLNETLLVARSGDPADLDGNGAFDDDVFIDAFTSNDSFLTDDLTDDLVDDRLLYTFATIRDGAGTGLGNAMLVLRLAAVTCPWDLDGNGDVGVTDLLALLAAWGTDPGGPPDFDGNGDVGVTDLLALLGAWGNCP